MKTDLDLQARVVSYLLHQQVADIRDIEVLAADGIVTMRGEVRSFYHKQLCLACTNRVAGVVQIMDEIAVVSDSQSMQAG